MKPLEFEKPLDALYSKIEELKRLSDEGDVDLSDEIKTIENSEVLKKRYSNLMPQQILQVARHPNRPDTMGLAS